MSKIRRLAKELSEGRKPMPVGTKRTWGGKEMVKTSTGWQPSSKSGWQAGKAGKEWGKPYGLPYHSPEGEVRMHRKGQKVRFLNKAGQQVGPEQANVAPAVAYAMSKKWSDSPPTDAEVAADALAMTPKLKAQPAPKEFSPTDFGASDPDMNEPISDRDRAQVDSDYKKLAKKYGDSPGNMTPRDQSKAAKIIARLPLRDIRGEQDQQRRLSDNLYKSYSDPAKADEKAYYEKIFKFMNVYDNILATAALHKLDAANKKRAAKRPTTESWMNNFRVLAENVAATIWKQIPMSTKMAVGAREPLTDGNTLRFKVLRGSFVAVTLDASDTYTVEHYRTKRGTLTKVSLGKVSDVYAESLGSIVYGITHGKI